MLLESLLFTLLAVPQAPTTAAPTPKPAATAAAPKPSAPSDAGVAAAPAAAKPPDTGTASSATKPAPKMTPEVKALVDRMQAFYEKTGDFKAGFKQDYKYKTFRRTQSSSGTVTYKKPGLMRWEYTNPSTRTFVLAGNKVYAYDPDAQTLTVAAVDTSQLSASVTFLFGQGKLADEFAISKGDCKDCKGTLLVLDPLKNEPRFRQVRLEVDPATAQVLKSTVVDPDGSENTIAFLDLKTNVGIAADSFKLNPPEGTRVDDFTKKAQ
ncbi:MULTISPECIES: outer membrane lipoprotein carrier protein LolA [Corallococcus]|uniref:LolA family protein n=1 Tax=Corallococcus TaxID=83461 RepID=UPI00118156A4|nr:MULTISPECIES: outer membrane lipoprotein carrier protein LolA [Corallococcus]NBD07884.1 outer membrane lipoprotein carrier protein LolA [Corallococcus silvisoli]TSC33866.1 outer membrane lipoprotein carrier protein LolA [Corallococcus sp. Z5C101001]